MPVEFTVTPIEGTINISHKFVFILLSTNTVAFYLEDTVDEVINADVTLSNFGDLPRTGGVDVRTVVGETPMDEDDIAGVILDDPAILLKNNPGGFMQG
jgi:hypothetical protein